MTKTITLFLCLVFLFACNPNRPNDDTIFVPNNNTFIVTSVDDNLRDDDGEIFLTLFQDLGYEILVWNRIADFNSLKEYLEMPIDTLYHTGHGFSGGIHLPNKNLRASDVEIEAKHTIISTCLTLNTRDWTLSFGDNAQTLMGYSDISYDLLDNKVVKNYIYWLERGNSPQDSWYLANRVFTSLRDRWVVYVKENNEVVEYSARSENPVISADIIEDRITSITDSIYIRENLLQQQPHKDLYTFQKSPIVYMSKDNLSVQKHLTELKPLNLSVNQAIQASFEKIREFDIPVVLFNNPDIISITRSEENGTKNIVAYEVLVKNHINGIQIRTNSTLTGVNVLVTKNNIEILSNTFPRFDNKTTTEILPISDALKESNITEYIKQDKVIVNDYQLIYTEVDELIVPGYSLKINDNLVMVISAIDGRIAK